MRAKSGVAGKHTCHTISPFFTRWQDSMYDSAYQSEPDEVLPYLQAHKALRGQGIVGLQGWHGQENISQCLEDVIVQVQG